MSAADTKFVRLASSDGGVWDVVLGPEGSILRSNGPDVAPSFQANPPGQVLPGGFSYTQPWEKVILERNGFLDFGMGNFTSEFERAASVRLNGASARGPACYTSQCDIPWTRRV